MKTILIDPIQMLALSIVVLFLGMYLTGKIKFLQDNYIPPAVTGGLIFSLVTWGFHGFADIALEFDMRIRDMLLLTFFSTVGLGARLRTLASGGKMLVIMVVAAAAFLAIQNAIGVGAALLAGVNPGYGLMAGSVSLAGGHGTAAAWGAIGAEAGLSQAMEVGLVFATFGLIAGGVIGGPIARMLIQRHKLTPKNQGTDSGATQAAGSQSAPQMRFSIALDEDPLFPLLRMLLLLALCVSLGTVVNAFLFEKEVLLPGFLTSMFVAIVLTNLVDVAGRPVDKALTDKFGEISLNLFLTMSMMSMQLWVLSSGLDKFVLLMLLQIAAMALFAIVIVFRIAGRDYDAAVMTGGFVGLGLGATPVALANMDAVTRHYGPSAKAFIVIPIVGAFFIDLLNAGVIQFFIDVLQRLNLGG
jgi:ESS family glutamate:Na+ symporter